jgi:3-dehydroquinate synthase
VSRFQVETPQQSYSIVIEREAIARLAEFFPRGHGRVFVVSARDVWELHGHRMRAALEGSAFETLFLAGGEENKRITFVEQLAEEMMAAGADRSSLVVAFGGGIVTDMGGFLAAIFMRGVPVIQVPTTLLAQVDAAIGGKTGVNLIAGKNLVGSFHQPLAVLIDPDVLSTLPDREYRAGLYEIIKTGIIASEPLFRLFLEKRDEVLTQRPKVVDHMIAEAVRVKAAVVSSDEREGGLRRILNFGHTFGHALEAQTHYTRFLHGEAVSWGMRAATYLAHALGLLPESDRAAIIGLLDGYGPIPSLDGIGCQELQARLVKDKKTVQSRIHFVLPVKIGEVTVVSDVPDRSVEAAIGQAVADCVRR